MRTQASDIQPLYSHMQMPAFEGVFWSVSFISLAVSDCAASLDIQAAPWMDRRGMQGSKDIQSMKTTCNGMNAL